MVNAQDPTPEVPYGLTEEVICTVETSWTKVNHLGLSAVGILFFQNIFEADPSLLALFPFKDDPDMYNSSKFLRHCTTVMSTVGVAVGQLRQLQDLAPVLQALGARHVGYGVEDHFYDTVGGALLKTLKVGLKQDWTPEVEHAWICTWTAVHDQCMIGARSVAPRSDDDMKTSDPPSTYGNGETEVDTCPSDKQRVYEGQEEEGGKKGSCLPCCKSQ
eukprot:Clim_evm7s227 gene=Clim_evmTU7s227